MIGIIVAMSSEKAAIEKLLENKEVIEYRGMSFHKGIISSKEVIVAEGGVGKVASTITCTIMLEHFGCDMIINIGTCGGMKENENILDIIVADQLTYHDWDELSINDREPGFENNQYRFSCTPYLIETAKATIGDFDREHTVFVGPIVSGDAFVRFPETIEKIKKYYPEAIGCDMESTSIGQVCSLYGVDFLIIRSISDVVIREGNEMDFQTYVGKAAERSALFTQAFLKRL